VQRSDDSDDELDDYDVGNIMIVTQTPPPANRKHDRTGNFVKRAKLTGEFAKVINDGLYYYEQVRVLRLHTRILLV
jgi:la-related protein 1